MLRNEIPIVEFTRLAFLLATFTCAATTALHGEGWPQWLEPKRDGVWRETGIVEALPTNGFTYRWRTPIGGGYNGPAVMFVRKPDAESCGWRPSLST